MARKPFSGRTADVLRKTIQQLEADPTIDPQDPAFVNLKCALLNRILQAETGQARAESGIHLVRNQVHEIEQEEPLENDSDSAIA